MSFRDLGAGGQAPRQPPKARRDEESSYERNIKANIQEMQENARKANEKLDQAQRTSLTRRMGESLDMFLERSRALSSETEQLLRDWTIHMAGEPGERQRKKFAYEKLQKVFEAEVTQLRDVAQRTCAAQEAAQAASERRSMYAEQEPAEASEEHGLLNDFELPSEIGRASLQDFRSRLAQERDEGFRRIQNQVSEVNQIIRDLASIVVDQGDHINSIESEAETASTSHKQAVQDLKKAVVRQRGVREKMCCLVMVIVLVFFFVIMPQITKVDSHDDGSIPGRSAAGVSSDGD